jgi:hypothetical protein
VKHDTGEVADAVEEYGEVEQEVKKAVEKSRPTSILTLASTLHTPVSGEPICCALAARATGPAYSERLVVGTDEGEVSVAELRRRDGSLAVEAGQAQVLATLDAPVMCVAVEPDLKWFVAGGDPGGIRVWDSNLAEEPLVPVEGRVNCVAVNGDRLAFGDEDGHMSVISLQTQEKLRTFKSRGAIRALSFSPDGRFLVAGGGDENKMDDGFMQGVWNTDVLIWDGDTVEPQVRDDAAVIYAIVFSPDKRFLAVGDDAGIVTLLQLSPDDNATFVLVSKVVESGGVRALSWAPDSQYFAVGGVSATVTVYALDQATPAFRTKQYDDWITGLSFGPRGHSLVVVGYGREAAEVLQLSEAASARPADPA